MKKYFPKSIYLSMYDSLYKELDKLKKKEKNIIDLGKDQEDSEDLRKIRKRIKKLMEDVNKLKQKQKNMQILRNI